MTEIKIQNLDNVKSFIESMEVNTKYIFPDGFRYKWVKIDSETFGYSWTMEYNYRVAGTSGYIYPMRNSQYVSTFKTEAGAKRNLFKKYGETFAEQWNKIKTLEK